VRIDKRNGTTRVQFDPALKVTMMAIDGTWHHEGLLIDVSDSGAQIAVQGSGALTEEFFLLLSSIGAPVFRRCRRAWVEGKRIGVCFDKTRLSERLPKRSSRNWESTPS
jgi:PilZ domain